MAGKKTFGMIVSDHDTKKFNIHLGLKDDTDLTRRVCEAQERGREVNCSTWEQNEVHDAQARDQAERDGYTYTLEPLV